MDIIHDYPKNLEPILIDTEEADEILNHYRLGGNPDFFTLV